VIADRRDAIEGRHRRVHQVQHRRAGVAVDRRQLLAGRALPEVVQLEQVLHRHAVAGALARAAADQIAGEGRLELRADLGVAERVDPGLALGGLTAGRDAEHHRRAQERVVVVVRRVVDGPPAPRHHLAAPVGLLVMPHVPHRLVGVRHPPRALAVAGGVEAPVVGEREIADQRADLEVAVERGVGAIAGADLGLLVAHERVDLLDRGLAVRGLAGELADQRRVPGLEAVDVGAVELEIDDALEARPGRRVGGDQGLQALAVAGQVDARVVVREHRATAIAAAADGHDQRQTRHAGELHPAKIP
jgi:hypothetical protein